MWPKGYYAELLHVLVLTDLKYLQLYDYESSSYDMFMITKCSSYTMFIWAANLWRFQVFRKAMPYLYDLCQARYVCYVMIHGIFMFMHLMLFTKRITYVF